MDPTAAPWRVVEEVGARVGLSPDPPRAPATVSRSVILVGAGAVAFGVLAFLLAIGTGAGGTVVIDGAGAIPGPLAEASSSDARPSTEPDLIVEIVGAVTRPGVFHLPAGARVGELVDAAGGYSTRVDAARASRELNLAARLNDGDQVRVPSRDDVEPDEPVALAGPGAAGAGSTSGGVVDLNRATTAELEALPGIGPVTANKILTARDEAQFASVDELRTRKLVGEKTFEKIKDLVTVR